MPFQIKRIHYSSDFRKAYKKLPKMVQDATDKKDALFRRNPFHPSLQTHKLHGTLRAVWSFRINQKYRILFEFVKDGAVFYDVGSHSIYG